MRWAVVGIILVLVASSGCFWHERHGDPDLYVEHRHDHEGDREHEQRREEHGDQHHEERHHEDRHHD